MVDPTVERSSSAAGGAPSIEDGSARAIARGLWRPALVIVAISAVVAVVSPREIAGEVEETRESFQALGVAGVAIFIAFYIVAAVCVVPQSVLRIAAGAVFGSALGIAIASIGSTLGATACFAIARYVARGSLLQRLKRRPRFQRLDRLTGDHGPLMVATSRLVPIFPGNLVNYAFGLTQVRAKTFVLWSGLGMLPASVVLVVSADAAVQGMEEGRVPWHLVLIVLAALATAIAATRVAHARVRQGDQPSPEAGSFSEAAGPHSPSAH